MFLVELFQASRTVVATPRLIQDLAGFCSKNPTIAGKLERFVAFRRLARADQPFSNKDEPFQAAKGFRRCHLIHGRAILFYQLTSTELRLAALVDHDAMEGQPIITYLLGVPPDGYAPVDTLACGTPERSGPAKAGRRVQPADYRPLDPAQQQTLKDLLRSLVDYDRRALYHASQGDLTEVILWCREALDWVDARNDATILAFLGGPAGLARKAKALLKAAAGLAEAIGWLSRSSGMSSAAPCLA